MILHVITACSRPERLPRLAAELGRAHAHGVDLRWHVGLDLDRRHVGGQAVKNRLLSGLARAEGWAWICDDDNLPHPAFLQRLPALAAAHPSAAGLLLAQDRGPHENRTLRPELPPRVGRVDAAQLVVRVGVAASVRIPETYDGDGHWIAQIAATVSIHPVDEVLTLWNGGDWL